MRPDQLAKSSLQNQGQANYSSKGNTSSRLMYPAVVINNNDPLGMNRIQARIVITAENDSTERKRNRKGVGSSKSGKDKDTLDESLVWCMPLQPEFFHARPQAQVLGEEGEVIIEGEMVFLILENPSDHSATRYWTGPIVSSQLKLRYQSFSDAKRMLNITSSGTDTSVSQDPVLSTILPGLSDIAIQGRNDADLMLKSKEVFLIAGKFNTGTLEKNTTTPSSIQLKQFSAEEGEVLYSQANITSTNINLFSPDGKFRGEGAGAVEKNDKLEDWGELANSLHPVPFGDELISLLDLMIRILLNHIHTPQESLVPTGDSDALSEFTIEGRLQEIISNHVRVN